ncbi:MAG: hypothetical protein ABFD89_15970 [Bryobacteraceae bacterium]
MAKVPTIKMRKGSCLITVNESDEERWKKEGFARPDDVPAQADPLADEKPSKGKSSK